MVLCSFQEIGPFLRVVEIMRLKLFIIFPCMLSRFSPVQLFATLWTIAHQTPLSRGFSRKEYWGGLPCPPPRNLLKLGIKPASPVSPALQADSLPIELLGSGKEPTCQCRRRKRCRFDLSLGVPWVGKISWRRAWQPTPVFSPGESHGQRGLACYGP